MKDDNLFLGHILDEIKFIEENFQDMSFDDFLESPLFQRASIRSLEIIGEAVKNLSTGFKEDNPQIEWKEIAGMRDRLIHRYFSVDWHIVWEVIHERLPELKIIIENAMK